MSGRLGPSGNQMLGQERSALGRQVIVIDCAQGLIAQNTTGLIDRGRFSCAPQTVLFIARPVRMRGPDTGLGALDCFGVSGFRDTENRVVG